MDWVHELLPTEWDYSRGIYFSDEIAIIKLTKTAFLNKAVLLIYPFPEENNILEIIRQNSVKTTPGQEKDEIDSYFLVIIKKKLIQEIARYILNYPVGNIHGSIITLGYNLENTIQVFIEEAKFRKHGYEFILESLSVQLATNILRKICFESEFEKHPQASPQENIILAIDFLKNHINEHYSLEKVAKIADLSPYHFIRVFKSETGKTPYEYLVNLKISRAKAMLINSRTSIRDICNFCGFNNPSHFTTVFKKRVGMTPSAFRKQEDKLLIST